MGGDDSQKLLPWRGSAPLRGANLRLNYEINTLPQSSELPADSVGRRLAEVLHRFYWNWTTAESHRGLGGCLGRASRRS
jgi:hypothetical protein